MKTMKKLIKGGTVVTDKEVFHGDIVIDDEKIAALSPAIDDREAEVIDAAGMYVIPGGVDIHTHMSLDAGIARSIDDFYTGTRAAACGGTTTIIDHMAFGPERCSLWHQVEEYHKLADVRAVSDYGFHGGLQHVDDQILSEIGEIARKEGITTFKAYMTYDRRLDDRALMRVLAAAKRKGITIAVHCENDGMIGYFTEKFVRAGHRDAAYHPLSRPAAAEAEAVNRLLYLAEASGEAPVYIVHLSSAAGLAELEAAQARGQRHIGAETCTQYLLLTDEAYVDPREGLKAIMSPPLRKRCDNEALWSAMQREKILTVATDHCPFTFADQKQQGAADFTKCPNGAPGVEERVNLLFLKVL